MVFLLPFIIEGDIQMSKCEMVMLDHFLQDPPTHVCLSYDLSYPKEKKRRRSSPKKEPKNILPSSWKSSVDSQIAKHSGR